MKQITEKEAFDWVNSLAKEEACKVYLSNDKRILIMEVVNFKEDGKPKEV